MARYIYWYLQTVLVSFVLGQLFKKLWRVLVSTYAFLLVQFSAIPLLVIFHELHCPYGQVLPQCLNKLGRIILKRELHGRAAKAPLMITKTATSTVIFILTKTNIHTKLYMSS